MFVQKKHEHQVGLSPAAEKRKSTCRRRPEPEFEFIPEPRGRGVCDHDILDHDGLILGEIHPDDPINWCEGRAFYLDLQQAYHHFDISEEVAPGSRKRYYFDTLWEAVAAYAEGTGFPHADIYLAWMLKKLFGFDYDLQGAAAHLWDFVRKVNQREPKCASELTTGEHQ